MDLFATFAIAIDLKIATKIHGRNFLFPLLFYSEIPEPLLFNVVKADTED